MGRLCVNKPWNSVVFRNRIFENALFKSVRNANDEKNFLVTQSHGCVNIYIYVYIFVSIHIYTYIYIRIIVLLLVVFHDSEDNPFGEQVPFLFS